MDAWTSDACSSIANLCKMCNKLWREENLEGAEEQMF